MKWPISTRLAQRRMRRWFAHTGVLLLLTLGLAIGLVSCSPRASQTATTIEFWTMQLQPKYTDYFNQLIREFETAHPTLKVRWVDVPWAGMESKILTAVVAKTPPDVVNLNPSFAAQLAERGAWLTLDDRIPEAVRSGYLPKIWRASQLNGKTFGVPWYLTTRIAIVNQALLQAAGIAQPPRTFEELSQAAEVIHTKTGKQAFFSTLVAGDAAEVLEAFVQEGVPLVKADGTAAFNTPKAQGIFQRWVKLYQNGWLPKEVLTEGQRYGIDLFQRGESAVVQASPGFLEAIAKNAPTIAQTTIPASQLTGSTGKKNVAVMNLVIPRDSRQPDAAVKFALFVSNNTNQLSFAKTGNVLPSTQAALKDPFFSQLPPNPTVLDRARIISAQQLPDSEVLIPVMQNLKQLQTLIYENLQAAVVQRKSVEQALNDAEQSWNQIVAAR
jgi:putative chitobiose transport system substrate-binding protein